MPFLLNAEDAATPKVFLFNCSLLSDAVEVFFAAEE